MPKHYARFRRYSKQSFRRDSLSPIQSSVGHRTLSYSRVCLPVFLTLCLLGLLYFWGFSPVISSDWVPEFFYIWYNTASLALEKNAFLEWLGSGLAPEVVIKANRSYIKKECRWGPSVSTGAGRCHQYICFRLAVSYTRVAWVLS